MIDSSDDKRGQVNKSKHEREVKRKAKYGFPGSTIFLVSTRLKLLQRSRHFDREQRREHWGR